MAEYVEDDGEAAEIGPGTAEFTGSPLPGTEAGADTAAAPAEVEDAGDAGYAKTLKPRHISMIAIGGAIGTGLFLGAGGNLVKAGPALALSYAVAGFFAFLVVRALGELVLHRPSSGSFVSYAREFLGERGAYVAGWMYVLNWCTTGMADITAVALYVHFWKSTAAVPQWLLALVALGVVLTVNLISVRLFGEMEFWFAIVKVAAIVVFMGVAVWLLSTGHPVGGRQPGPHMISDSGGFFAKGVLASIAVLQNVVFAYAAVEMVGITAGETEHPERVVPKAVNSIMWRIALFYVGSIVLLTLLLPWNAYSAAESPFVTVLSKVGLNGAGSLMNAVVLTAAMSSLNSGLYSTGRILRSMAAAGSAPRFTQRMSRNQVPYGGICLTAAAAMLGVGLNAWLPGQAFDIVVNVAALGVVSTWGMIMICHLRFVRRTREGSAARPAFRLPLSPLTELATLAFLAFILVDMGLNGGSVGRWTILLTIPIAAALALGWRATAPRRQSLTATPATAEAE